MLSYIVLDQREITLLAVDEDVVAGAEETAIGCEYFSYFRPCKFNPL